jgi:hypothetical protein
MNDYAHGKDESRNALSGPEQHLGANACLGRMGVDR